MRFTRNSIAAALTIAALGILAAVALASGGDPTTSAPAPAADTDPPAKVQTETVRRTVHRDAPARSASSDDDGTADQGPGDAPATPVAPTVRHDANDDHGNSGPGSTSRGGHDDGPNHDLGDDRGGHGGDDGPGHDAGDDHGGGGHSGHGGGGDDD
jgi:hypothetical protein